ncbi:hypothetical protein, partial [Streptomyces sp. NPDC093225]|uniref:hypothetical protein n=1 Tax=Streptomyces sp. NPDC093225 TaxID=3366034 RepID=UPI0038284515
MELFAVRPDGGLYGNSWGGENAHWHGWYRMGAETFDAGAPVAALSRFDDHMEVWAVRPDGGLYGNWWGGEDAHWHGWERVGPESFDPRTPVAVVSRNDDHMEVFAVRPDGGLYGNSWGGENAHWHGWYRIGAETFDPRTPIATVSRNDDHMEIWAVRPDGGVYGNWWGGENAHWQGWYRIQTGHEKIDVRWRSWGAAAGPFGGPTGPKEDVPGGTGLRQRFEHGEIASSPDQDMVVSVFRLRNEACFEWSRPHFEHDYFRYDISYDQVSQGQAAMQHRSRERGRVRIWARLQGFGEYAFTVKSCTEPTLGSDACKDWSVPVRAHLALSAETPDPGGPHVSGVIAERWHELGAWAGPLGKPVGAEDLNPDGGIRNQEFEYGRIFTAPAFGPGMVIAAYQRCNFIEVNWGGSDTAFNEFRVEVNHNGTKILEEVVEAGPLPDEWARPGTGCGQFRLPDPPGTGFYTFRVHPNITSSFLPDPPFEGSPYGSTPEIGIWFERRDAEDHITIDVPALDGTPAAAYASQGSRVNCIARYIARVNPLLVGHGRSVVVDEDSTMALVAHLQALADDPDFRVPGELPDHVLAHVFLRQLDRGDALVGTTVPGAGPWSRKGDYDMALKGLMVIACRYRNLLTAEELEYILLRFVPPELAGPVDRIMHSLIYVEVIPETENHLLMIESTRYLVNQLLFELLGDPRFDNVANGVEAWLLDYLHTIAKHDFLEFNARPYQRMSLHALFNLHEFAKEGSAIKAAAQILLDYVFVKFAVSSDRGRRVAPFRRLHENLNRPDEDRFNQLVRTDRGDQVAEFSAAYTGPIDRDGKPEGKFVKEWTFVPLISGLAAYRPPPAAYVLAMTPPPTPMQHRIYHGVRPEVYEADELADGGVEIYYRSPSFLLAAGGMFLNSGYGWDDNPVTHYKDVAVAQATTLIPTRTDPTFVELIRFERYFSGGVLGRYSVNTAVHRGFACGANLAIPRWYLSQLSEAELQGNWAFIDLGPNAPDAGHRLGLYVAAYRTAAKNWSSGFSIVSPLNVGFLYAIESTAIEDFATFQQRTRARNPNLNALDAQSPPGELDYGGTYTFNTPDGNPDSGSAHAFTFRILSDAYEDWPEGYHVGPPMSKYATRIISMDGLPLANLDSLPLVEGPFLNVPRNPDGSGGHVGLVEVRHPGSETTPLVLDFRNARNPVYGDNAGACPQPWLDRAGALAAFAWKLRQVGKGKEAAEAMLDRLDILMRLAGIEPDKYRPMVGAALIDLLTGFRAGLGAATALSMARRTVQLYEELAGIRPTGSTAPVDYQNLTAFTPNQYWYSPGGASLANALYQLAYTHWEGHDA